MSSKKVLTVIALLSVVTMSILLVACTPAYTVHYIAYGTDKDFQSNLKPAIITSVKELNDYFSQENYIIKPDNFAEETKAFNDEFFASKILVPAFYDDMLHNFKGVRVTDNVLELIIKDKTGLLPDVVANLKFFEFDKKVAKGATQVKIVRK